MYTKLLRAKEFKSYELIETGIRQWLLSLPKEIPNRPLLQVLADTIRDHSTVALQRSTLILLTQIASQLVEGPSTPFTLMVPILLQLADLPDIPEFPKPKDLAPSTNFDIADLALITLSLMGRRGPAGALLPAARQDFSPHLEGLACYSLESHTLITPTVVPFTEKNYLEYRDAVGKWLKLRDKYEKRGTTNNPTNEDIQACIRIHKTLLDAAEEVRYLTYYQLLDMLRESHSRNDWRQIWQHTMSNTLQTGKYIDYQQTVLLWAMLFPQPESLTILAAKLKEHFNATTALQRNAQRFFVALTEDLRDLRDLRDLVLTQEIAEKVMLALPVSDRVQYVDMLIILLGRVLQIQTTHDENNASAEFEETQRIALCAKNNFVSATNDEVKEAALDIIRYLPVRTADELTFVIQFAEAPSENAIQKACGEALRYARGYTPEKERQL